MYGYDPQRMPSVYRVDNPKRSGRPVRNDQLDPIAGDYLAKEVFSELAVPIFQRMPFAESLYVNVAGRYSECSMFGSKTTYRVGLD